MDKQVLVAMLLVRVQSWLNQFLVLHWLYIKRNKWDEFVHKRYLIKENPRDLTKLLLSERRF
jgi:hypothetical protein